MSASMKMSPQFLREAGYYCTNNSKEDYNLIKPAGVWDESSGKAHWKNRRSGQPFFAVFNHTITHESQIRKRPHTAVHDPKKVRVPAYHPDTPEVRQDWAQYYDNLTTLDEIVGRNLRELADAGLAEDTIVFYYGDHGSGMPRSKRCPQNSGLHVPLIVHIPEKFAALRPADYRTGGETDRLVSFVDLAPTLLSLIGMRPPVWMQGHAFAGSFDAGPQPFVYGFRGRMDERYDLVRSVRDQRYVYVRHFMPHLPYGQHVSYMFETPTTRVWKQLFDAGKLKPEQQHFWKPKPTEELFDLQSDPDEVHNLAASAEHQDVLKKLRTAQRDLAAKIRDVGFLPEGEMHARSTDSTPYDLGRDAAKYPFAIIFAAADKASSLQTVNAAELKPLLSDSDSAVRYWAALGCLMRQADGVKVAHAELVAALKDSSPSVRVIAAQSLAQFGSDADVQTALPVLLELANLTEQGLFTSVLAMNAIDSLDERARPIAPAITRLPRTSKGLSPRTGDYIDRLVEKTLSDLGEKAK